MTELVCERTVATALTHSYAGDSARARFEYLLAQYDTQLAVEDLQSPTSHSAIGIGIDSAEPRIEVAVERVASGDLGNRRGSQCAYLPDQVITGDSLC
ncbi:hypothetical protein [Nocardia coubleae]|uniref:Uncharacterized protein n=1 Tax=Nocardia coubleae TaxID=356147 RepID=A0A846WCJ0_9NOCA|nr:hypothetical protein [Nocardia coubleae]NKX91232.1 hypothetical protein [Nocardia coubleae]